MAAGPLIGNESRNHKARGGRRNRPGARAGRAAGTAARRYDARVERFPDHLREHFQAPRHVGEPPGGADLRGEARNPACGDHLVVFLKLAPVAGGRAEGPCRIEAAGFLAQGCPAAMATGSAACEVLIGLTADASLPQAIESRFEATFGPPRAAHRHALALVTEAVRQALASATA